MQTEAASRRMDRAHNERAWLAWTTAALGRVRRLPDLRKLLAGAKPKRKQTWQEQFAIMERWRAVQAAFNKQKKR